MRQSFAGVMEGGKIALDLAGERLGVGEPLLVA
jgi:hypothetical protein